MEGFKNSFGLGDIETFAPVPGSKSGKGCFELPRWPIVLYPGSNTNRLGKISDFLRMLSGIQETHKQ